MKGMIICTINWMCVQADILSRQFIGLFIKAIYKLLKANKIILSLYSQEYITKASKHFHFQSKFCLKFTDVKRCDAGFR